MTALLGTTKDASASTGCTALANSGQTLNAGFIGLIAPITVGTFTFDAGDVLTYGPVTGGGVATSSLTGTGISLTYTGTPVSQTIAAAVTTVLTANATTTAANTFIVIRCTSATSTGTSVSPAAPAVQVATNAQNAMVYGQQTLQNYNDWTTKAIINSFNIGRPRGVADASPRAKTSADVPTNAQLKSQERDIVDELADLRANTQPSSTDNTRIASLESRLATTRQSLTFAHLEALMGTSRSPSGDDKAPATRAGNADADASIYEGPTGSAPRIASAPPAFHLNAGDLAAYCDDACDVADRKWNVWLEGKMFRAVDSLVQTNSTGVVGSVGGDYKVLPWLATGVSFGVENFQTGYRSGTSSVMTGFTAEPYAGFRLSDNVFASAFAGVSTLTYFASPMSGVNAQFQALRFFVGGGITGVWRDGPWRLQPSMTGQYGTEQQYGYSDTAGNVVPGQVVNYGRISAGPEIGYTIKDAADFVTIEPYVLAKANLDFSNSAVAQFNGTPLVVRSGTLGSGTAGLGFTMQFAGGSYLKIQGTYESIGVTGLDIWAGLIRAGMTF